MTEEDSGIWCEGSVSTLAGDAAANDDAAGVHEEMTSCSYFHGEISLKEAHKRLKHKPVGTYLLRTSAHPDYLYALSWQTAVGPRSCRIVYGQGKVWFQNAPAHHACTSILEMIARYNNKVRCEDDIVFSVTDPLAA